MEKPEAMVAILDVGQGDAIYIRTTSGADVLIDGGPDGGVLQGLGGLMPLTDHDIDLLILTHPHVDHVSGQIDVFQRYNVHRVICACQGGGSKTFQAWLREAGMDAEPEIPSEPMDISFGSAQFQIFPPPEGESLNDQSLIVQYDDAGERFLFTGDAEEASEAWFMAQGFAQDVDVLKVGHHGSNTSSSEPFLAAINAEAAVISVGERNRYGHPHAEALTRLQAHNIKVARTDRQGSIIFWLDEGEWHASGVPNRIWPLMVDLWYHEGQWED